MTGYMIVENGGLRACGESFDLAGLVCVQRVLKIDYRDLESISLDIRVEVVSSMLS